MRACKRALFAILHLIPLLCNTCADSDDPGDEVPEAIGSFPQRNRASSLELSGFGARDVRSPHCHANMQGKILTFCSIVLAHSYEEFVVEGDGIEAAQDEEGEMRGLEMLIMLLLDFVQCLLSKVRWLLLSGHSRHV